MDFDPATLHGRPRYVERLAARVRRWKPLPIRLLPRLPSHCPKLRLAALIALNGIMESAKPDQRTGNDPKQKYPDFNG